MRKTAILLLLWLFAGVHPGRAADKLNVLFLISDDCRPELGCYGAPVQTPNLDALAAAGVRFNRAYCQYPLCNPSRTSMLTGRHPTATGVLDNRGDFRKLHPDWITLPQFFKQRGYVTLRSGKVFHGGLDDAASWTEGAEQRRGETPLFVRDPDAYRTRSDRVVVLEGDGEKHRDFSAAEQAITWLKKYQKQPFFLACGFTKPHSPPEAPKRFYDLYDVETIQLPPDFSARPEALKGFPAKSITRNSDLFIDRDATPDEARKVIRAYRASVSWMDWLLGRVVAQLDALGLRQNTVIVFWGDHGYHLGEKGKWAKHNSLYEVGARVPLLVLAPGRKGNGQACERTIETLDLYPTLAELCGLETPAGLQGRSIVPLLDDPEAQWHQAAFTVTKSGSSVYRAVRDGRWRYAEYDSGQAMLIDEAADPHEMKNLVNNPSQGFLVQRLKSLLGQLPMAAAQE